MKMLFAFILLVLCVALGEGAKTKCTIKSHGKLSQFSNTKVKVLMPCRFQATTFDCEGYKVHVNPGMKLDSKARYFTDNVMVSLTNLATGDYWKGKATSKQLTLYFNDTVTRRPFKTRDENMTRGTIFMRPNAKRYSATLGVKGTSLLVTFYGYKEGHPQRMRANGVRVYCKEPAFGNRGSFPTSLCGNFSDTALRLHTRDIGLRNQFRTVIYDILNSNIDTTSPTCEAAQRVFRKCDVKSQAVKACSALLTKANARGCMNQNYRSPMDAFIYCLRYVCEDNRDACDLMSEALEGCPENHNLPGIRNVCTKAFNAQAYTATQ